MISYSFIAGKHHIEWKSVPIKRESYQVIKKYAENARDFSPQSIQKISMIDKYITENKIDIRLDEALAIIRLANLSRIIKNTYKLEKYKHDIIKMGDPLAASKKYDISPLNALRLMFEDKYKPSLSNRLFKSGDISVLDEVDANDVEMFFRAERADSSGLFLQQTTGERSKLAEDVFVQRIRSLGIVLETEDDLKARNISPTPDILFTDEVHLNGNRIYWMDFKDYAGTDIPFIWNKNRDQSKKYNDKWGYGAICYAYSYVEDLADENAELLAMAPLLELDDAIYGRPIIAAINNI
jgi:hypothetical protein